MRTSTAMEKDAKERLRHDFKTEQSVPTDRAWRTMEPRGPELPGPARLRRGSAPEAALWLWATGRSARTVGSRWTRMSSLPPPSGWSGRESGPITWERTRKKGGPEALPQAWLQPES